MKICREQIRSAAAWTPESIGGKAGLTRTLNEAELAGIRQVLADTRNKGPQEATLADVKNDTFRKLVKEIRASVMGDKTILLLSGLQEFASDPQTCERVLWLIGLFLGRASQENHKGSRIAYVQEETENPTSRGHRSSAELRMHSDSYEILGLMCVRKAKKGGLSAMASSLTVHNRILEERPEFLDLLYTGRRQWISELKNTSRPATEERIPTFCYVDGEVSCLYKGSAMRMAAKNGYDDMPADLDEALRYFMTVAERDDVKVSFMLEPGEIILCNNFTNLHSRTDFEDDPANKRLLLRLHCDVLEEGRKIDPALNAHSRQLRWFWEEGHKESVPA